MDRDHKLVKAAGGMGSPAGDVVQSGKALVVSQLLRITRIRFRPALALRIPVLRRRKHGFADIAGSLGSRNIRKSPLELKDSLLCKSVEQCYVGMRARGRLPTRFLYPNEEKEKSRLLDWFL